MCSGADHATRQPTTGSPIVKPCFGRIPRLLYPAPPTLFLPRNFLRQHQPLPTVPTHPTTVPVPACDEIRTLYPPITTAAIATSPWISLRFGRHLWQGFRLLCFAHCIYQLGSG